MEKHIVFVTERKKTEMGIFTKSKNILVVGNKGMLGRIVEQKLRAQSLFKDEPVRNVYGVDVNKLDIGDLNAVHSFLTMPGCRKFDCVINCAAITDTAKIESSAEYEEASYNVSCRGVQNLAAVCAALDIHLVHVSTDYVLKSDEILGTVEQPVNKYGLHKLLGEKFIESEYARRNSKKWTIIRASWLFGPGKSTYVSKILTAVYKAALKKLNGEADYVVPIVTDALGKPTSCNRFATYCIEAAKQSIYGIWDGQYKGATTSRAEFAERIVLAWSAADGSPLSIFCASNLDNLFKCVTSDYFGSSGMKHPLNLHVADVLGTLTLENWADRRSRRKHAQMLEEFSYLDSSWKDDLHGFLSNYAADVLKLVESGLSQEELQKIKKFNEESDKSTDQSKPE